MSELVIRSFQNNRPDMAGSVVPGRLWRPLSPVPIYKASVYVWISLHACQLGEDEAFAAKEVTPGREWGHTRMVFCSSRIDTGKYSIYARDSDASLREMHDSWVVGASREPAIWWVIKPSRSPIDNAINHIRGKEPTRTSSAFFYAFCFFFSR